ncbi:MAG: hypothetical protein HQK53_00360 [Oligoflexia bacterium]|nr:hypothetical protein [Oligoflexia bacterium]
MDRYFEYDRLINEEDFCNFTKEQDMLKEYIDAGDCVKVFGPRNFGKTSMVKNIIARKWEAEKHKIRAVIYVDFFSIESIDNISFELTKAFGQALSNKKNLFEQGMDWVKKLKNVRPVWQPATSGDGLGEFSIRTENNEAVVDFELIFKNIHRLQKNKKIEFLIIMDEFQEIAKIKGAEAKMRGALQEFSCNIPVVILGSKQHILSEIFDRPQAPFYSWGITLEMKYISYQHYHNYINKRFLLAKKKIDETNARYLQDKLNRIPEAINRLCDFIARNSKSTEINGTIIDNQMKEFIDRSRSIYEENFARFRSNHRKVLLAFAKLGTVTGVSGQDFLKEVPQVSKSGVTEIVRKLLDDSIISRNSNDKGEWQYQIADPFMREYLINYKLI